MKQKKLTKGEIEHLALKIIKDVNEVNQLYNDTLIATQKYKDDVAAIEATDPLKIAENKIMLALKTEFGTDYTKHVNFSLSVRGNSDSEIKSSKANKELSEYKDKNLKKIYSTYGF